MPSEKILSEKQAYVAALREKQMCIRDRCNYITVGVPFGSLLWLRNLTKGKEELPFYVDDNGQQRFIYML